MKLNILALALAVGIVWGIYLFLVGLAAAAGLNLPWFNAGIVEKLSVVYFGYSATVGGALLGLLYGFICGFVGTLPIAWLYNKFCQQ